MDHKDLKLESHYEYDVHSTPFLCCYRDIPAGITQFKPSCFIFLSEVDAPFARWSKDQVCDWLQEQGLGLYVNLARVWILSGQTLMQASQQDLEKVRHRRTRFLTSCIKLADKRFPC